MGEKKKQAYNINVQNPVVAFKQFQDTNHNVVDVAESRGFELLGVVQTAGPVDSNIATLCVTLICIKVRLYTTTSNVSSSLLQQNKTKHIITTAEKRPHETIPTKNPPPPHPYWGEEGHQISAFKFTSKQYKGIFCVQLDRSLQRCTL